MLEREHRSLFETTPITVKHVKAQIARLRKAYGLHRGMLGNRRTPDGGFGANTR